MKRFISSPDGLPSKKQKSSLFEDSSHDADSSVASSSRPRETNEVSSPFYPGRTMYGGAGAYRSFKYLNEPYKRKTPIVKPTSKADETEGMSQTAKRILDILQQYPSPLKEAKQLAPFMETRKNYSVESQLPSFSANSSFLSNSTIGPKSNYNSPQVLRGPSISSLIKMHRDRASQCKPSTPEPKTSPVARQISASQSSSLCLLPKLAARSQANDHYRSKMKNTLTRRSDKNNISEHDILPPFKLPTAVLSIGSSNLPDFSLSSIKTQPLDTFMKEKELENKSFESKVTNGFSFSSPLGVVEKKKEFIHKSDYIFRKPLNVHSSSDILLEEDTEDSSSSKEALGVVSSSRAQDEAKSTPTATSSSNNLTNSWGNLIKPTGNWQCSECWSSNKKEEQKCLACGAANSTSSTKEASENLLQKVPDKLPSSTLFSAQTNSGGDWKCKECWITNDKDVKACIACGTITKSATHTVIDNSKVTTDSGFGQLLKEQQSQWECSSCLTRNEQARMKCVCCEAPKPGTCNITKEMNLEIQPTSTFKFGIDQTDSKKSVSTGSISVNNLSSSKDDSTAPSTGFSFGIASKDKPTSSFSFGVPAAVTKEKKPEQDFHPGFKLDNEPAAKPSVGSFTFGVPAPATSSGENKAELTTLPKIDTLPQAKGAFVFGVPTKADPKELQVANEENLNVPDVNAPSAASPSFGINTIKTQEKPKDLQKPAEVKPITTMPNFSFQVPQPTLKPVDTSPDENRSTTPTITPSFNFGAPKQIQSIGSVVNTTATTAAAPANGGLFGSNISGINPLSTFSSIQKPSPVTTSTPNILFGSIAAPAVITPVLGQIKSPEENISGSVKDSTTTTATTPLFSFGSSASAPKPAVGGFNFTFGTGNTTVAKSEAPPAFGSPSVMSPANSLFGNTKPIETTNVNTGIVASDANKSSGLFGAPQPATNLFSTSNAVPQATVTSPTFGSQPSAFGTGPNTVQLFGSPSVASPTVTSNMFGLSNQNVSSPAPAANLFGTASPAAPTFGNPAPTPAPALQFGNSMGQNVVSPTFGSAQPPTFGNLATSTPAQAPAFNFGSSAASSPVFGFGQPQQSQPAAAGIYSFGALPSPAAPIQSGPGLQFNMGTFSTPTQGNSAGQPRRRIAKAVRRTTPR